MSRQKISDYRTLIKCLKNGGFRLIESSKHEKWYNAVSDKTATVPHKHTGGKFSRVLAEKIAKEAGLFQ